MKRYCILALAGVVASAATLFAIPDRVGVFLVDSNSRVEDFALNLDTWSEEKFSSDWETKAAKDPEESYLRLNRSFVVFGVAAEEVKALKRDGDLERFLVTYAPDNNNKTTTDSIVKTLHRNIEAYTGEKLVASPADDSSPGYRCRFKDFEIYLGKQQPDNVLVAIQRASPST